MKEHLHFIITAAYRRCAVHIPFLYGLPYASHPKAYRSLFLNQFLHIKKLYRLTAQRTPAMRTPALGFSHMGRLWGFPGSFRENRCRRWHSGQAVRTGTKSPASAPRWRQDRIPQGPIGRSPQAPL